LKILNKKKCAYFVPHLLTQDQKHQLAAPPVEFFKWLVAIEMFKKGM
jgi:hypothetical protein